MYYSPLHTIVFLAQSEKYAISLCILYGLGQIKHLNLNCQYSYFKKNILESFHLKCLQSE